MKLRLNITPKLALVFVLFAAALLVVVSALADTTGRAALQLAITSELLARALDKQAALQSWFDRRQAEVAALAASPSMRDDAAILLAARRSAAGRAAHDRLVAELRSQRQDGHTYLDLLVIEPEAGQVVAAATPREEDDFRGDRPYVIEGKRGSYLQSPYYSVVLQAPAMTAAAPLRSADGKLVGVLAARLNLADVNAIVGLRSDLHQTDDSFLLNQESEFVTQPHLASEPVVLQRGVRSAASQRCLAGTSGALLSDDYRGVPAIVVYRWLADRRLCLIVKIDQAEAFEPVRAFGLRVLLIGSLALLLASAVAVGLARTITRPILALQVGVMRFARGELHVRLPVAAGDELGMLARDFNAMAAVLAEKEAQLHATLAQLEQQVEERTAELRRSNADLQQFAYVASHDLQEPLRMVASYTQLLARRYQGKLDANADDFIAYAVDGATRMQTLINDLLAYSRVGTRGKDLSPVDCAAVLDEVCADLALAIEESGAIVVHERLPIVQGDASQLRQLFQNLIGNAIKFHGAEPPRIHIAAEPRDAEWVFSVCDNGIGIDQQYAERVFVIFQRLHTRAEYPGTGIGLAICKKIVERHGGHIWLDSAAGQGSGFFFTILRRGDQQP